MDGFGERKKIKMTENKFRQFSELPTINLGVKSFEDVDVGEDIVLSKTDILYLDDTGFWEDQRALINERALALNSSVTMESKPNGSAIVRFSKASKEELLIRSQNKGALASNRRVIGHIQEAYALVQAQIAELEAKPDRDSDTNKHYLRDCNRRADLLAALSYSILQGAIICDN